MSDPAKFKLKTSFAHLQAPPSHVWVHYTQDLSTSTIERPVSQSLNAPILPKANRLGVTLTLEAARRRVIAVADNIARKQVWRRGPLMETGGQALQAGDMYCEVGPENDKVIVRTWKVVPTQ